MRLFLKSILAFLSVLCCVCILSYVSNSVLLKKGNELIPARIGVLIIGDSHSNEGLDPKVIKNSINISKDGDPVSLNYFRLKYLLKDKHIDNLVFNLSTELFTEKNEIKYADADFSNLIYRKSYPFLRLSDLEGFDVNKLTFYEIMLRERVFPNFSYMHSVFVSRDLAELPFVGGFSPTTSVVKIDSLDFSAKVNQKYALKGRFNLGKVDPFYIDSISNLCLKHGVKLYVVSMPQINLYHNLVPEIYRNAHGVTLDRLDGPGYSHVTVVRFRFSDKPDNFGDFGHLNFTGAQKASLVLDSIINLNRSVVPGSLVDWE